MKLTGGASARARWDPTSPVKQPTPPRRTTSELLDDWLNIGPMQLGDVLPAGWRERVQRIFEGRVLVLSTLGRSDLLKSKLFALCDRGTDLLDCIALAPTAEDLAECM